MLNFLRRNFRTAPPVLKQVLYASNVRPILEYACAAWDPATKLNIDALEHIQKRAAKFVTVITTSPEGQAQLSVHLDSHYSPQGVNISDYVFSTA